jgi:hypothetical protein
MNMALVKQGTKCDNDLSDLSALPSPLILMPTRKMGRQSSKHPARKDCIKASQIFKYGAG